MKLPFVKECALANKEHQRHKRQYAHVHHKTGVICVANAFFDLPSIYKAALVFHELGHLAGADGELEADKLAEEMFGVEIERVDSEFGENLECLFDD